VNSTHGTNPEGGDAGSTPPERPTEPVEVVTSRTEPVDQPATQPQDSIDFFGAGLLTAQPIPSTPAAAPTSGPAPEPAPAPEPPQGPTATQSPAARAVPVAAVERRGVRVRTVVLGVVMLVISVACLVSLLTRVHVDAGVVGLALLVGAGAALLAGGLSAAISDLRKGGTRYTA